MITLVPHPSAPEGAFGVAAEVDRLVTRALRFTYRLTGSLARVRLPVAAPSTRSDRLWEHTCFEAFVALADAPAYVELNFAPSGAWAVYGFDRYRAAAPLVPDLVAPHIAVTRAAESLELEATVALDDWSPAYGAGALRIGLTAVVEATDGRLTYWAIRHPAITPDFHDAAGFTFRIAAREEPAP